MHMYDTRVILWQVFGGYCDSIFTSSSNEPPIQTATTIPQHNAGNTISGFVACLAFLQVEADREDMGDALPNATAPSSGQAGWEWKADTQKWVECSGKPPFRVVPDDTKPTLRDPLSTSDPTETEHFILRPPPFNK